MNSAEKQTADDNRETPRGRLKSLKHSNIRIQRERLWGVARALLWTKRS